VSVRQQAGDQTAPHLAVNTRRASDHPLAATPSSAKFFTAEDAHRSQSLGNVGTGASTSMFDSICDSFCNTGNWDGALNTVGEENRLDDELSPLLDSTSSSQPEAVTARASHTPTAADTPKTAQVQMDCALLSQW
jgi:hypothetical protein